MSAMTAHLPIDHSVSPSVRRGVAAGVLVLHLAVVAAIVRTDAPEVEAGGQTVMVSFVTEVASAPVPPVPPPPALVQEAPPVLATERQVVAEAAPTKVAEVVAPVLPPVTAPSAAADVVAPAPSDAVPAALPPTITTPPSFGAAYLNNPRPAYPMVSRRLREQGVTLLRVEVSGEGRPQQVIIERSSGSERLDRAARMAVRDWRFVPAREGDKTVTGWVTVPINWKLEN